MSPYRGSSRKRQLMVHVYINRHLRLQPLIGRFCPAILETGMFDFRATERTARKHLYNNGLQPILETGMFPPGNGDVYPLLNKIFCI